MCTVACFPARLSLTAGLRGAELDVYTGQASMTVVTVSMMNEVLKPVISLGTSVGFMGC